MEICDERCFVILTYSGCSREWLKTGVLHVYVFKSVSK